MSAKTRGMQDHYNLIIFKLEIPRLFSLTNSAYNPYLGRFIKCGAV